MNNKFEYNIKVTDEGIERILVLFANQYKEEQKGNNINNCKNTIIEQLANNGYDEEFLDLFGDLQITNDAEEAAEIMQEMRDILTDGIES